MKWPKEQSLLLNLCQENALKILSGAENAFVTGVAGSGKSFLIRHFLKGKKDKVFPILASTGAAAILVGGRTFHSYFGLGIMQGGFEATIDRAISNKKLLKRLKGAQGVVIDEISMLSGVTLRAAEKIACLARESSAPWGGLKVIAVGDFAQLPPVNPFGQDKDWAFTDPTWRISAFKPALLNTVVRTTDFDFINILNSVRNGEVTSEVREFLDERQRNGQEDFVNNTFEGTVLFPHRETTERYNLQQLQKLDGVATTFATVYSGNERYLDNIIKNAPVPRQLILKVGALVMIRQNDPQGRWYNGSLGHIISMSNSILRISLNSGTNIELEKISFNALDAEGKEVASATNFPVNLAYATTIHKAQGMTIDKVHVDLSNLWEPGHAYVALSRARSAKGLFISKWSPSSIKSDPVVKAFNESIWGASSAQFN